MMCTERHKKPGEGSTSTGARRSNKPTSLHPGTHISRKCRWVTNERSGKGMIFLFRRGRVVHPPKRTKALPCFGLQVLAIFLIAFIRWRWHWIEPVCLKVIRIVFMAIVCPSPSRTRPYRDRVRDRTEHIPNHDGPVHQVGPVGSDRSNREKNG